MKLTWEKITRAVNRTPPQAPSANRSARSQRNEMDGPTLQVGTSFEMERAFAAAIVETATPDPEDGIYIITNYVQHNNVGLLNDNADEPIVGVFPIGKGRSRELEKVRCSAVAEGL